MWEDNFKMVLKEDRTVCTYFIWPKTGDSWWRFNTVMRFLFVCNVWNFLTG